MAQTTLHHTHTKLDNKALYSAHNRVLSVSQDATVTNVPFDPSQYAETHRDDNARLTWSSRAPSTRPGKLLQYILARYTCNPTNKVKCRNKGEHTFICRIKGVIVMSGLAGVQTCDCPPPRDVLLETMWTVPRVERSKADSGTLGNRHE